MQNSVCCYIMDWFLYYSTALFQLHELYCIKREGDREWWIGKNLGKNILACVRTLSWKASVYPIFGSGIETDVSWIRMPLSRTTLFFYFYHFTVHSVDYLITHTNTCIYILFQKYKIYIKIFKTLLHVSITRSSSGSIYCSLLKL